MRYASQKGIQLSISTNGSFSTIQHFRDNSSTGILLDFNCEQGNNILNSVRASVWIALQISLNYISIFIQCSKTRCFYEIYKWLIFENQPMESSLVMKLLDQSIIYVDAEIEYLNLNAFVGSGRTKLYKIFNNGWNLGGKLIVTFDRYLIIDMEKELHMSESIHLQKPKYEHRGKLTDITLRVGIVVSFSLLSRKIEYSELSILISQLPKYEQFESDKARITHILSDNNTAIDILVRFPSNVLAPIKEMVQSKSVSKFGV